PPRSTYFPYTTLFRSGLHCRLKRFEGMNSWLNKVRAAALGGMLMLLAYPASAEDVSVLPDKSRVVAIGGAITETVFALGEGRRLDRKSTRLNSSHVKI